MKNVPDFKLKKLDNVIDSISKFLSYDYLRPFFERGTDFCNRIASGSPFAPEIRENLVFLEKEYSEKPEGYRLMIKARLLVILTYLIRHFRDCSKKSPGDTGDKRRDLLRLEQALNYINMNFKDAIGLEAVAAKAFMTPQYFSAFFKKAAGVNFIDYVNGLRVNHAVKLLRETNQKIIRIASECGFNNTANFNAIFKKVTGHTPSQIREDG